VATGQRGHRRLRTRRHMAGRRGALLRRPATAARRERDGQVPVTTRPAEHGQGGKNRRTG
jgi:hypothetical protein